MNFPKYDLIWYFLMIRNRLNFFGRNIMEQRRKESNCVMQILICQNTDDDLFYYSIKV